MTLAITREPGSLAGQPGSLVAGETLGKYEILERLAQGGMAEVYLARAPGLEGFEKLVALKRILPHLSHDDRLLGMFLKEARLAATLHHPNIVQVFEVGLSGGCYFFTMEYVDGVDVRTLLRRAEETGKPPPLEHAVAIAISAAAGLHHAHEQVGRDGRPLGIVHRDVSPSNLLVSHDGFLKVSDFGIAKAESEGHDTRTGTLKGKFAYMSPEQCRSERLDRRSDVFSLGIVLYELTTGTSPFRQANDFLTMSRIVDRDAPSPRERRPEYPPELERILLTALHRDPARRFQTAQDLQLALEQFVRDRQLAVSAVALASYMRELGIARQRSVRGQTPMTRALTEDGTSVTTDGESAVIDRNAISRQHDERESVTPARRNRARRIQLLVVALAVAAAGSALAIRGLGGSAGSNSIAPASPVPQEVGAPAAEPARQEAPGPLASGSSSSPIPVESVVTPPSESSRSGTRTRRPARSDRARRSARSAEKRPAPPNTPTPDPVGSKAAADNAAPTNKPSSENKPTPVKPRWDRDSWYVP